MVVLELLLLQVHLDVIKMMMLNSLTVQFVLKEVMDTARSIGRK